MLTRPACLSLQCISAHGQELLLNRLLSVRVVAERDGYLCYDEEFGAEGAGEDLDEAFAEYQASFVALYRRLLQPVRPPSAGDAALATKLCEWLSAPTAMAS